MVILTTKKRPKRAYFNRSVSGGLAWEHGVDTLRLQGSFTLPGNRMLVLMEGSDRTYQHK